MAMRALSALGLRHRSGLRFRPLITAGRAAVQVRDDMGVEAVHGIVDAADETGFGIAATAAHAPEEGEAEAGDLRAVLRDDAGRLGAQAFQGAAWSRSGAFDEGFDVQVGRRRSEPADQTLGPGEG